MKRSYIGKETLSFLETSCATLKYYILEEEIEVENEEKKPEKHIEYGIEIEKQDEVRVEKSQVKEITTDQTRIDQIVKSLMKNSVTPVHLHDVIEDML